MQTTVAPLRAGSNAASGVQALLLSAAAISSAVIWWQFAPRYFYQPGILDRHSLHIPWLFLHILAASAALFTGPFLLWSGHRRSPLSLHRPIGFVYLVGGAL